MHHKVIHTLLTRHVKPIHILYLTPHTIFISYLKLNITVICTLICSVTHIKYHGLHMYLNNFCYLEVAMLRQIISADQKRHK